MRSHFRDRPEFNREQRERCMRGGRGQGWGERSHGGRMGRRHGGGRRPFEQGELRLLVLALLSEKPRHGYELIKEIEERMGGAYSPSPGVIYPLLTMLEDMGLARLASEENGKKLYALTPEGEAELASNKRDVDAALGRMQGIREMQAGGRAPQIVRALENFRVALHLRLERGGIGEEQAHAIAAALDNAAQAIERT